MSAKRKGDVRIYARAWSHFCIRAIVRDLQKDTTVANEASNLAYSWKSCAVAELTLQVKQYVPRFEDVVQWDGHWSNDGAAFFSHVENADWHKALEVLRRLEHRATVYVNTHRGTKA